MPVMRTKGGYKVKSYKTGKLFRSATGKVKVFTSKTKAKRAAGKKR